MNMRLLSVISVLVLIACGPSSRNGPDGTGGGADGNNGGSGGDGNDGCSDAAKLIYVVDSNNQLSTFDGSTKSFHTLGALSCAASGGATPFSMGVDRNANAYVLYSSGELFKVDTSSLACTKTAWTTQLGLQQFGMGFSTDTAGGTTDTLYIAGGSTVMGATSKLAKLDVNTFSATQVGTVTGWPELTGTGNAELWGFFPDASSPRVEKINKATGAAAMTYPESSIAGTPSAWAFAFWGGDYWIFLMKDFELSTTVYQINGANGTIKSMTAANGRTIVGAGVSTCAPVVIL
jgi:hypothetical protein